MKKYTKEQMAQKIVDGVINENYFKLVPGFASGYDVTELAPVRGKSRKTGEEIEYGKFRFESAELSMTVFETQLFQALVLPKEFTKRFTLGNKNQPLYFLDEIQDLPGVRRLADCRDEDGGFTVQDKYTVAAAAVYRSSIDSSRWTINWKHYTRGHEFVAYLQSKSVDKEIKGISERKMLRLASLPETERYWTDGSGVERLLPDASQLVLEEGYAGNPRQASHVLLLARTW
jgi:hypothetical protein